MGVKWFFTDPVTDSVYTFGVNPNQDQQGPYQKNLQYEAILIPGGLPLLYEGADTPTTMILQGTILAMSQQLAFVEWYQKRYPVYLTDDKGYVRYIYITNLQFTRTPVSLYPWKSVWQMTAYVLTESFPG